MGYLVVTYVETMDEVRAMRTTVPATIDNVRIVGVFRMPPSDEPVCAGASGGCKEVGWRRHARGYMVHACGRRNPNYRDQLSDHAGGLMDTYGINLLPRGHTPAVFRNPEGWDRKKS